MTSTCISFIHELDAKAIPDKAKQAARTALLDLLGVAAAGSRTELSRIICQHALSQFGNSGEQGSARILFNGRRCSTLGAALAGGMMIDSVDAHDGHKLTKGHAGCGVLPALLAFTDSLDNQCEDTFLSALVMGYEIGCRAGIALHRTACDYHTSGAWVALAAAAVGARLLNLSEQQTREALGIAEYHGPRSQMMRCIDHPTMLKDGSGWGAMSGVSAAFLAQSGFTGSPAVTLEQAAVRDLWDDLGSTWRMCEQYMKPYPVCRWAQPGIVAALNLCREHDIEPGQVRGIEIGTFHESKRLAQRTPETTEQAQYSLPFPVAAALVHGDVAVQHISGSGLQDQQVLAMSQLIKLVEVDAYNSEFPQRRISHVNIELTDGQQLCSGPTEAAGDPEKPLTRHQVLAKFSTLADPVIGVERAQSIRTLLDNFNKGGLSQLNDLIYPAGIPTDGSAHVSDVPAQTAVSS